MLDKPHKSFFHLNWVQFFGAFNDNVFRWLLTFFLIAVMKPNGHSEVMVTTIATVVFIIPFLLFSDMAGVIADRYSKGALIRWIKLAEIIIMVVGTIGFFLKSPIILFITLFMMAAQSAFFGPIKYGIIPELLPDNELSKGNGKLAIMSFSAIILGTFLGSYFSKLAVDHGINYGLISIFCIVIAVVGYFISLKIHRTPAGGGTKKISLQFYLGVYRTARKMGNYPYMLSACFGLAMFWAIGVFLNTQLIPYGQDVLGIDKESSGMMFLLVSFGIGFGSWLASRISGRLIEFGLVPIGVIGLSIGLVLLSLSDTIYQAGALLIMFGVFAGMFTLPLNAFLQWRAPASERGEILATTNFIGFLGMTLGSLFAYLSEIYTLTVQESLLFAAVLLSILIFVSIFLLPDFFVRFILLILTRMRYRIVIDGDNLVANHDGMLIVVDKLTITERLIFTASQQRRIRFVLPKTELHEWNYWYLKIMKFIPAEEGNMQERVATNIADGNVVCVDQAQYLQLLPKLAATTNVVKLDISFIKKHQPLMKFTKGC